MNENEVAKQSAADELSKIPKGDRITPDKKPEESKESEEDVKTDDVDESEEEDVDEEEIDESDEDETDEDDESEDDDDESHDGKVPAWYAKKQNAKAKKFKQERDTARAELRDALGAKKSEVSDDDFKDLTDELAKELGIEDKDNAAKLLKVISKMNQQQIKGLQEKIDKLEARDSTEKVVEAYKSEWTSFQPTVKKEFPNASDEELKKASALMDKLSHMPGIGGVKYVDSDGKEKINPYDLDYIFYKNKDKFEEVMTAKKVKGMEQGRSRGASRSDSKDYNPTSDPLPKNPTISQLRARDKAIAAAEGDMDSLRSGHSNVL